MQCSNLERVVREMAGCNGFSVRPFREWPDVGPEFDVVQLDEQASSLHGEELLIFVDGEETEVQCLTNKLQLAELNEFLNEIFDGYLHHDIAIGESEGIKLRN